MKSALRKFTWIAMLSLSMALLSCDQAAAPAADQSWTKLGFMGDGTGGGTLYRRLDPENGNTIYMAIGVNSVSIFVIPKK